MVCTLFLLWAEEKPLGFKIMELDEFSRDQLMSSDCWHLCYDRRLARWKGRMEVSDDVPEFHFIYLFKNLSLLGNVDGS